MCGYIQGKRCTGCGKFSVAWWCDENGGVGAIECRECGLEYDIDKITIEMTVKRIEEEREANPTS